MAGEFERCEGCGQPVIPYEPDLPHPPCQAELERRNAKILRQKEQHVALIQKYRGAVGGCIAHMHLVKRVEAENAALREALARHGVLEPSPRKAEDLLETLDRLRHKNDQLRRACYDEGHRPLGYHGRDEAPA